MSGLIRIHHQDGIAEYTVTRAVYGFIGCDFYLEVEAKPSSQHFLSQFAPRCTVALVQLAVGGPDIAACLDREFTLPTSENEADVGPDRFTNFYLFEHNDIDQNHIRFFIDDGEPAVEWQGVVPDVVYYDERAKSSPIEVRCRIAPGLFQPQR